MIGGAVIRPSEAALRRGGLFIGAAGIVWIFWWLQFSTQSICCGDFDGYYHIKWSRMLWEGMRSRHFPPRFVWLPLTTLNPHDYVDHHFLFHIFLIPFTWFGDLRLGAKIAATLFASLAVFSCYWLMVRYRVRYPLVWLLVLLASSAPFLYRMNMAKAPPLAIIYLVIGVYLLFERKYWPLLPLAFVFALTYDMVLLLALAASIWFVVVLWSERANRAVFGAGIGLLLVFAGTALGFVINPYFPKNVHLLWEHLRIKVTPSEFPTRVGQEWYPYDTREFLLNCAIALVAMLAGYIAFNGRERKRAEHPLFFLVFSTALMIMTMRWKRFAEYWPPFAVIFAAFTLQPIIDQVLSRFGEPTAEGDEGLPRLNLTGTAERSREPRELVGFLIAVVLALVFAVALFLNVPPWLAHSSRYLSMIPPGIAVQTASDIGESAARDYYQGGARWIRANVPPGEMIFNTDWDDFPRLFYYDPTHVYVSGLDPTYLLDRNPELSGLYEDITLGKKDDPGPLIRDRFGARYVFSDNTSDHDDFYKKAYESGWLEQVYKDGDCTVLRIRDQRVER